MVKYQTFRNFIFNIDILSLLWYNERNVWEVLTAFLLRGVLQGRERPANPHKDAHPTRPALSFGAFYQMRASSRLCQIALNGQR
jgi:hypothetical protein